MNTEEQTALFENYKESFIATLRSIADEIESGSNFEDFQLLENPFDDSDRTELLDGLQTFFSNAIWQTQDAIYDIAKEDAVGGYENL